MDTLIKSLQKGEELNTSGKSQVERQPSQVGDKIVKSQYLLLYFPILGLSWFETFTFTQSHFHSRLEVVEVVCSSFQTTRLQSYLPDLCLLRRIRTTS